MKWESLSPPVLVAISLALLLLTVPAIAQVGISSDNSQPDSSAGLEIKFTNKGFLPPRMTTAQRDAIFSPAEGLVIYNTEDKTLNVYNGSSWGLLNPIICGQSFVDPRDGKIYNTVKIGLQCWMKENLNLGTKINGATAQTDNDTIEKYCYENQDSNCATYGGLYQWNELMNYTPSSNANPSGRQGICPTGWHIPSDSEWFQLTTYLGFPPQAGGKMKETGLAHWLSPNYGASNSSGFTGLPGGGIIYIFGFITEYGLFWSSEEEDSETSWARYLYYNDTYAGRYYYSKQCAFSVRCVQN